jgi:DNA-binding response OmpR family regulator
VSARILIVEDNALIALDLSEALQKAGFEVMGPAMSVANAMSLIKSGGCDAAVLDVNLRGETSETVARELRARAIPFMTLTGYAQTQQPTVFKDVPAFTKPVPMPDVIDALRRCLGPAAGA